MSWRATCRREQVEPVWRVEITRAVAGNIRVPLLPHDALGQRIDDNDPVPIIIRHDK